jgi:hypothetical protein
LNYYLGMTGSVSFDKMRKEKYIGRTESNLPNHFPAWPRANTLQPPRPGLEDFKD